MSGFRNPQSSKLGSFSCRESNANVKRLKIGTYTVDISVAGASRQSR